MTTINPIILIPARRASTRLPDKPLLDIAGKPMILHVWEKAKAAGTGPVIVATDDGRIAAALREGGGDVVLTRSDHPSGSDRIREAARQVDPEGNYNVIINVQGDLPTLDPHLIEAVLAPLEDEAVDIATLAAEITDEREKTDPHTVKPVIRFHDETCRTGTALYFSRATIPYGDGPLYHHIGIYAYRREALERFISLPPSPLEQREKLEQLRALENSMRIDVAIVDTVPLGVDTPSDLQRAREIILASG